VTQQSRLKAAETRNTETRAFFRAREMNCLAITCLSSRLGLEQERCDALALAANLLATGVLHSHAHSSWPGVTGRKVVKESSKENVSVLVPSH
jgi:hypothetical protein